MEDNLDMHFRNHHNIHENRWIHAVFHCRVLLVLEAILFYFLRISTNLMCELLELGNKFLREYNFL